MSTLRKIWLLSILAMVLGVALLVLASVYQYKTYPLLKNRNFTTVIVPPGTGSDSLVRRLYKKGLISYPFPWKLFILFPTRGRELKAGEYAIKPGMTLSDLVQTVINGGVYLREITLIEGWTYRDLRQELSKDPHLKHVMKHLDDSQVMGILGSKRQHPEGLLFPDTYFYTWGDSDFDIVKQSYGKMIQVINQLWVSRKTGLPYKTAYDALVVASLIEKETALKQERPLVASVIVNRLRAHMRLQIDPTVIYGLGGNDGDPLTRADLKRPTLYNTYLRHGLPPTPIAMPSEASIKAALSPATTKYYYFVARGDGSHQFSESYLQHLRAIRIFMNKKSRKVKINKQHVIPALIVCQFGEKNANVHVLKRLFSSAPKSTQCIMIQK